MCVALGTSCLVACAPGEAERTPSGRASPSPAPDDLADEAEQDPANALVYQTEAIIDGVLPSKLRALGRSVMNKAFPSEEALAIFADTVDVADLGARGDAAVIDSVDVTVSHWHVAPDSGAVQADELAIWGAFIDQVDYFRNASFKVVRGEFVDSEQRSLDTLIKFAGLARTTEDYRYAKAEISVRWTAHDSTTEEDPLWRISSWKTKRFNTYRVRGLLFTDVFADTVSEDLYCDVAERTKELENRSARIVQNLDAGLTFDDLSASMDDGLVPFTKDEVAAVVPGLDEKGRDYFRLRYGEQVREKWRLGELLDLTESEVARLAQSVDEPLAAERKARRPEVAARVERAAARHRLFKQAVPVVGINSGAVSVTDIDRDGLDDLFVSRNERNYLLRNRGDGTFEEYSANVDLPQPGRGINAALFVDTDNDGDLDLFYGYKNGLGYFVNEDGRFVDRTATLLDAYQPRGNVAMSAADYDGDGLIDVYVQTRDIFQPAREMLSRAALGYDDGKLYGAWLPEKQARRFYERAMAAETHSTFDRPGPPNMLLRNTGGGRFAIAPNSDQLEVYRNTHFASWSDFDQDGDPDLYVANDFGPNNFFRNDDGVLVDITDETATTDIGFGMGVSWGDYDNDGDQDLYVTNMYSKAGLRITNQAGLTDTRAHLAAHGNTLFRNDGGEFRRVSGEEKPHLTVEPGGWGWGAQFLDIDNDGFLDIYAPSGYISTPAGFEKIQDT